MSLWGYLICFYLKIVCVTGKGMAVERNELKGGIPEVIVRCIWRIFDLVQPCLAGALGKVNSATMTQTIWKKTNVTCYIKSSALFLSVLAYLSVLLLAHFPYSH